MASAAIYKGPADEIPFTAAGTEKSGDVMQKGGRAGIVAGATGKFNAGEAATLRILGRAWLTAESATTFSEGDAIGWDGSKAVAGATSGSFDVGFATKDKVAGETVVEIQIQSKQSVNTP